MYPEKFIRDDVLQLSVVIVTLPILYTCEAGLHHSEYNMHMHVA